VAGVGRSRSGAEEQSSRAGGSIHSHAPPPTPPPGLVRPPLPTCTYTCPRALTERLDAYGEDGDKSTNVHPTRPRHEVAGRHPSSPSPLERRNISLAAEIDRPPSPTHVLVRARTSSSCSLPPLYSTLLSAVRQAPSLTRPPAPSLLGFLGRSPELAAAPIGPRRDGTSLRRPLSPITPNARSR
jgi:hypothetical protein